MLIFVMLIFVIFVIFERSQLALLVPVSVLLLRSKISRSANWHY